MQASPLAQLMSPQRREVVADAANTAILRQATGLKAGRTPTVGAAASSMLGGVAFVCVGVKPC